MRRRDLLVGGISVAGAVITRSAYGQVVKRGAVVIGVDKIKNLDRLRAAASGARDVAAWLRAEGFEVRLLDDSRKPVKAADVKDAINELISISSLEQLVIYFAGHGFVSSYFSEFWMLSEATSDLSEAISLNESREASRYFGLKNVVFISDACRSPADALGASSMRGTVIFPRPASRPGGVITEVDKFLATRIGEPAWEVSVGAISKASQGIYTACLLDAFLSPYNEMVVQLADGNSVVPNRRLKNYLMNEVPKKAQAASIQLNQSPDAEVCSDEPTYIAHVRTSARRTGSTDTLPTLADVASVAVGTELAGGSSPSWIGEPLPSLRSRKLQELARDSGYDSASAIIVRARGLPVQLPSLSGFVISGQHIKSVTAAPGVKTRVRNKVVDQRPSAFVEVDLSNVQPRAASVALRFADGSGTVIAALEYFVGGVIVDRGRVTNVSYEPSAQSPMRSSYQSQADQIEQLRAAVAAAARFGVFRIEGPRSTRTRTAEQLANRIRVLKGIDPTLGLYAAYAYADAGIIDQVRSVRQFMHGDLNTDLFDVVMLTGDLSGRTPGTVRGPFPFCPMLSQGWGFLRVRQVTLPENLIALRERLRPSLWTSIDVDGMNMVESALGAGRVS